MRVKVWSDRDLWTSWRNKAITDNVQRNIWPSLGTSSNAEEEAL